MDERWRLRAVVAVVLALAPGAPAAPTPQEQLEAEHRAGPGVPLGPALDHELKVEHRDAPVVPQAPPALPDITSGLPAASPNLFIWTDPDGTYRFGMMAPDQWRVESRDVDGNVQGRYVYRIGDQVVDVSYDSGPQGYRARGAAIPGGQAPAGQADVPQSMELGDVLSMMVPDLSLRVEGDENGLQGPEEDRDASPYGALRVAGQQETRPSGDGVTTFSDDQMSAVVTDVDERQGGGRVVYPVLKDVLGSPLVVGPPLLAQLPVQPAAIPV